MYPLPLYCPTTIHAPSPSFPLPLFPIPLLPPPLTPPPPSMPLPLHSLYPSSPLLYCPPTPPSPPSSHPFPQVTSPLVKGSWKVSPNPDFTLNLIHHYLT
ncbi:hypothetical protein Pcinc_032345 [Petrolisthes cinctipes]|uniref:Uncharacterized protein n=1 Tax=Petrolisthes cinctipes TaxID=88211 RepID=A0AAE1K1M4_PETCI|nr:hypothetical protein Pcinc_032345 [Petrolisthes cinctipes]